MSLKDDLEQLRRDPVVTIEIAETLGQFFFQAGPYFLALDDAITKLVTLHKDDLLAMARILHSFSENFARVEKGLRLLPASVAYEPLFVSYGMLPLLARIWAYEIKRLGADLAHHRNMCGHVLPDAIRRLALPGCRKGSAVKFAKQLADSTTITCDVSVVFSDAGLQDSTEQFLKLLDPAASGDALACKELCALAAVAAPHIKPKRGRKISLASAMHEVLLTLASSYDKKAYTRSAYDQAFVDPRTVATARESGQAAFDPRPSVRRFRAQTILLAAERGDRT